MQSINKTLSKEIQNLTLTAILFAISIVLSIVENSIPTITIFIPGVKLGLSNIPVMYSLFFIGKRQALTIAILKSIFVIITRGNIAGLLSFCGGTLSIIIMAFLLYIFKERISYMLISIFGAAFHNIGQLFAVSILYSLYSWWYLPILLLTGIIAGICTAILLRLILPAFMKLGFNKII